MNNKSNIQAATEVETIVLKIQQDFPDYEILPKLGWKNDQFENLEVTLQIRFMEKDVYSAICEVLENNGFKKSLNGDMIRSSTGCSFSRESLFCYKTVLDFQLAWSYS